MNILEQITFDPTKPAVVSILKNDRLNYLAIGLLAGQLLKKHQTHVPTLLTVIKGEVVFLVGQDRIPLKQYDIYEIPVSVEHAVQGVQEENIFTLIQEKQWG